MRQPLPDAAAIAALPADGGPDFNRLVFESSPYLRQHARNPVDWYPWGEEALARAAREDRPIFLSVGYSTCHWCHVMEHESFEDAETAALMNAHYVCVKVDREELPDLDAVMMTATQLFTGRGGWPNSLWLTPDGKPWFCGTYFPREDRGPRQPGFKTMLVDLRQVWDERRDEVLKQAEAVAAAIVAQGELPAGGSEPGRELVDAALGQLAADFDSLQGGFGSAPKFPPHQALALLLAEHARSGDPALLDLVTRTLAAMAAGGIHDQLGGGFHRYSTDARWLLPHFEKMLYDNALLLPVYAEAARRTGRADLAAVARGIAGWALRDMRDAAGGFHAALDADSEGEEGLFYLWRPAELAALLGEADAARFARIYGVEAAGNFREEASGRSTGESILYLPQPLAEAAAREGVALDALAAWRETLRAARDGQRVWPERDDKVLTAWNGLMIAGLARAGRLLDEPVWIAAAARTADFVLGSLRADGRLLAVWREGEARLAANLDDHAFLALGLLELHEATGDARWLAAAREQADTLLAHFADPAGAGFFFTADDEEVLFLRRRDPYDGALPSGNGVAAQVLLRLAEASGVARYREAARAALTVFQPVMARAPRGTLSLQAALADYLAGAARGLAPLAGAEGPPEDARRQAPVAAELYLGRESLAPGESLPLLLRAVADAGWHLEGGAGGEALAPPRLELIARRGPQPRRSAAPAGAGGGAALPGPARGRAGGRARPARAAPAPELSGLRRSALPGPGRAHPHGRPARRDGSAGRAAAPCRALRERGRRGRPRRRGRSALTGAPAPSTFARAVGSRRAAAGSPDPTKEKP